MKELYTIMSIHSIVSDVSQHYAIDLSNQDQRLRVGDPLVIGETRPVEAGTLVTLRSGHRFSVSDGHDLRLARKVSTLWRVDAFITDAAMVTLQMGQL